tara:strand:+ start:142 stop:1758 length:1617 start_codon:yes stop_codon:yes gene_type:complete
MPTITLNKKDVLKLIGKPISDKILSSQIPMLGTDLEEITKDEIKVEIFPNRPDLLSEEGFARALSQFLGIKTGLKKYKVNSSNYKILQSPKTKKIRPYAATAVIKKLKFTEDSLTSLMNLQEKLHITHGRNRKRASIGVYDLDKIKFPLTYTTKHPSFKFQPLESSKESTLMQILEAHPKGVDYAHLLKDAKEYPIWIDSNNQVLSMPPIINSEQTKVTENTKNIFIDVTGTNKEAVEQALNILCTACADRGGEIHKVSSYPNLEPKKIKLDTRHAENLIGLKLSHSQIQNLLKKMGMEYDSKSSTVFYPSFRTDIINQVDIIEDLTIAYGYDHLKSEIPNVSTIAEEDPFEKFKNIIAEICTGLGLTEVSTYHLINKKDVTTKMNSKIETVNIKNSLSQEYNALRPWIIPSLLNILKINRHNDYPQNIFELGKVFIKNKNEIQEPTRIAIAISHSTAGFTEAKQILDAILNNLELPPTYESTEHSSFISGRTARVSVKNKKVAYLGELHPEVLNNFDLDTSTTVIELNLTEIYNLIN